uniref:Uncharacterized protein LOC104244778 n=1 Tax=Nicotiana sylvestris TaxID=4096 RepID=A0A1U7Y9F6_NICSY|nr:PREDICTED: uncharacterized protein LOC104244778 [Nicotiana sylvestris]
MSSSQKRDPAWAYGVAVGNNNSRVQCIFCQKMYNGGIHRHKRHLIGGFRDVKECPSVPDTIKKEMRDYVEKKNELKNPMSHGVSMINLLDEDSQMDEDDLEVNDIMRPPPSKSQRKNSTSGSGSSTAGSNVKGPLNLFFSQKPNEKRKGEAVDLESCRKSLRERVVDAFARWMYDAGLPFNCVNYTDSFGEFIEAVGQYGPGMKPPTYHEVRVPCLKKEVEKTDKIVEEHKAQ